MKILFFFNSTINENSVKCRKGQQAMYMGEYRRFCISQKGYGSDSNCPIQI